MARDTWDPQQYERFRDERSRPFYDLVERILYFYPFKRILFWGRRA